MEENPIHTRAEQALEKWRQAISTWADTESRPIFCHPWSEKDFERRFQTFPSTKEVSANELRRLAAEGFEYQNGEDGGFVGCGICKVKWQLGRGIAKQHDTRCPWFQRPFAVLKLEQKSQIVSSNVFDEAKKALMHMEEVRNVMQTIKRHA